MCAVVEFCSDQPLHIKRQALFSPPRNEMHHAAHPPEKILASSKQRQFSGRKHPFCNQFRGILNAVNIFGDPKERVEIAQSTFAFFDIGLDKIT